ncbi:MAG TPA: M56 family metallopeptidase, partial [Longimicrobium sp.]|nr:M56 family metallopeptidase [Longimicrobium sp.]
MTAWIAWAMALSLAVTLAALAVEAALRLFGRPARGVWAAALALSLAAPILLPRQPGVGQTREMEMGTMEGPSAVSSSPSFSSVDAPAPVRRSAWTAMREKADGALPYLWLAASLAMAAGLAGGSLALRRRRRTWRPAVVGGAPVLISARMGPAVVGFIDSDIVLPRWTLEWAAPLQRLIVRHEREHIDAGDPPLLLFALLAVAAAPWNPALWWQLRRLRLAIEVDCDARILRREPDVGAYGRLLLEVGRLAGGARIPVTAFSEPRSFLERRIRIMTESTPSHRLLRLAGLGAVLLG